MSRLTKKNNRIVLISNYSQTPSKEKIAEANRYNKLAELEDLIDEMDSVRIVKRDGIVSLHIDAILTSETFPIVKEIFKDKLK